MKRARGKPVKKTKTPPSTAFTVNGVEYHAEPFVEQDPAKDGDVVRWLHQCSDKTSTGVMTRQEWDDAMRDAAPFFFGHTVKA